MQNLTLTDRIRVWLPESHSDLLVHADWIKNEVLAVEIQLDAASDRPRIERSGGAAELDARDRDHTGEL
jgi:hypothetical protein